MRRLPISKLNQLILGQLKFLCFLEPGQMLTFEHNFYLTLDICQQLFKSFLLLYFIAIPTSNRFNKTRCNFFILACSSVNAICQ